MKKSLITKTHILFALLLAFFASASFVQAKEYPDFHENKIKLDRATIEKGYTIRDAKDSCLVGIFPDVFHEPSEVRVAEIFNPQDHLPPGRRVSDVCVYNIEMEKPFVLDKPIIVSLEYRPESSAKKIVHFYDRNHKKWRPVPTELDEKNNRARAFIHFPFSYLAVFETGEGETSSLSSASSGISAKGAVAINAKTGEVLYQKNAEKAYQIASLTKLMTAYTFLDINRDLERTTRISSADMSIGSRVGFKAGDVFTMQDLLYGLMVPSGNDAARALAHASGVSYEEFIIRMNNEAIEKGFNTMHFEEVSGLGKTNMSSALEFARFAQIAFDDYEILKTATAKHACIYSHSNTNKYCFKNTNKLLWSDLYVTGGKTGYLPPSWGGDGASLVLQVKDANENEIIVVVLGSSTVQSRFDDAEKIARESLQKIAK